MRNLDQLSEDAVEAVLNNCELLVSPEEFRLVTNTCRQSWQEILLYRFNVLRERGVTVPDVALDLVVERPIDPDA